MEADAQVAWIAKLADKDDLYEGGVHFSRMARPHTELWHKFMKAMAKDGGSTPARPD
ncbi:MAG: hypothetical protein ACYCW6_02960 [Candidatus Xenobia bacterium]